MTVFAYHLGFAPPLCANKDEVAFRWRDMKDTSAASKAENVGTMWKVHTRILQLLRGPRKTSPECRVKNVVFVLFSQSLLCILQPVLSSVSGLLQSVLSRLHSSVLHYTLSSKICFMGCVPLASCNSWEYRPSHAFLLSPVEPLNKIYSALGTIRFSTMNVDETFDFGNVNSYKWLHKGELEDLLLF